MQIIGSRSDKSERNCRSHNLIPPTSNKSPRHKKQKWSVLNSHWSFQGLTSNGDGAEQFLASVLRMSRSRLYFMGGDNDIVPNQDCSLSLMTRRSAQWGPRLNRLAVRFGTCILTACELVAKRIIEAAKNGERDPIRLRWQAGMGTASMTCRCMLRA
jgi:hypothetical protein